MDLYEKERANALAALAERGAAADGYGFALCFLPPELDDGTMSTVRYEVTVTAAGGTSRTYVGGIGLRWVEDFLADVDENAFS